MFKRLSTQFIASTLLVMLLSSLLAFMLANVYYHIYLKPENDARITRTLEQQKAFILKHQTISSSDFFNQLADLNFQVIAIHHGKKTFYGTPFRVDNLKTSPLNHKTYHGIKHRPFNIIITGFFDNETENTVGTTMKVAGSEFDVYIRPDVGQSMAEFRIFLAILLLLIVLFSVLFVLLSSKNIVSPVVKLKSFAERIRQGDYSNVAAVRRQDEIGVLAREMEEMSRTIKSHQEMNERFVANVSHEIQSPITNLLGLTRRLKDQQDLSLITEIEHQSERLSKLTSQLLLLAAIDNEGIELTCDSFNGRRMIQEVIHSMMYQLDRKDQLVIAALDDIQINGHRDLLFQLVTNLLSNAVKYSPPEAEIRIALKSNNGHPVLTVSDHGQGMSEETKMHLFERFYKADVNEDEVPSNGLGMAIVHEIVLLHQADIKVDSKAGKGTTFTVTFQ
ncbi:HAMP domain-containing sensor histidine kinase [Macrococcus lamae]|uniref:histidine kinase n=1 Tax=Macrococcus lamae TaxID=198484 RepID=A0A4R6BSK0_9STAP|nr:HAMP domain-containing sensor histidine kinase [Macrococcus lamae]TDM07110.1 HAMP domain-containing histidine kinase [Macrococcus lamae]